MTMTATTNDLLADAIAILRDPDVEDPTSPDPTGVVDVLDELADELDSRGADELAARVRTIADDYAADNLDRDDARRAIAHLS